MSKKFILSIIIVVIILLAISGAVWFAMQKNTTPPVQVKNLIVPHINSILPTSGPVGTIVVIPGFGFTADNTVLFDSLVAASHVSVVANGQQSIPFTVPLSLAPDCRAGQMCPMFLRAVTPGSYSVFVENQNGTSNTVNFTVTASANTVIRNVGDKEFNFLIQKINTNGVDGLWYTLYPVAMSQGQPKTLQIGDIVGYACEGRTATVESINSANQTVTFKETIQSAPPGGCPI